MGCGRDHDIVILMDTRFKFINYDHVSSNKSVISCDKSKDGLEMIDIYLTIWRLERWLEIGGVQA